MSTFIFKNYWLFPEFGTSFRINFPQPIFVTATQAKNLEKRLHTESGFA